MLKNKFFFDYIYYRACRFFLNRDGKDGIRAVLLVSLMQLLLLMGELWGNETKQEQAFINFQYTVESTLSSKS